MVGTRDSDQNVPHQQTVRPDAEKSSEILREEARGTYQVN